MASARSADMRRCATTPRSVARSRCSRCRSRHVTQKAGASQRAGPRSGRKPVNGLEQQSSELLVKRAGFALACVAALGLLSGHHAAGQAAKKEKDGKWETADGTPTYNIAGDGTVDWYTFSGFRRYHSECH